MAPPTFIRYKWPSILQVAQDVHECNTGSSDALTEDGKQERVEWLVARLAHWTISSSKRSVPYDESVRALVRSVVMESKA